MLKFLYRTILPVCVLAVMFSFGAVKVGASQDSEAELRAQIAQLMALVAQLQGQSGGSSNLTLAPESQCPSENTKYGDRDATTGGQVSRLQNFLVKKYNLNRADYVTGYFGRGTQGLVSRFEADNGLPVTGWANEKTLSYVGMECNKGGEGLSDLADVNIEETSFAFSNGGFTVDGTADFMQGRTLIVFASTYNYSSPSLETMDSQVLKGVLKNSAFVSEKGRWSSTFKTAQYREKETYYIYVYDAKTRTLMSTFTKSVVKIANGNASCTITSNKSVVSPGEKFTLTWKTKGMSDVVMYQEVKGGGTVKVAKRGSMQWTAERDGGFSDVFGIGMGGISAPFNPICEVSVKVVSGGTDMPVAGNNKLLVYPKNSAPMTFENISQAAAESTCAVLTLENEAGSCVYGSSFLKNTDRMSVKDGDESLRFVKPGSSRNETISVNTGTYAFTVTDKKYGANNNNSFFLGKYRVFGFKYETNNHSGPVKVFELNTQRIEMSGNNILLKSDLTVDRTTNKIPAGNYYLYVINTETGDWTTVSAYTYFVSSVIENNPQTSAPTITTVLPKNGSGMFEVGDAIPMKWEYANIPANSQIIAKLELIKSSGTGSLSGGTWQSPQISGSGSFTYPSGGWRTGSSYLDVPGTYRLYTKVRQCSSAGCSYSYPQNEFLPTSALGGSVDITINSPY